MTSDGDAGYQVPCPQVDVTEPVEVGRLYGPDGDVLLVFYDRSWVPFGFQPPDVD